MTLRTVRGKIVANSALIVVLLAGASLYTGFATLELDQSVEALFHNTFAMESYQSLLDQTQASLAEYLRTKSSDSLRDFIRYSGELSDESQALNEAIVPDALLLLQRDLGRVFDTYLAAAQAGIDAKRGRDTVRYAQQFEQANRQAGYARILISDLKNQFLSQSLVAFSTYRSLIPGVLLSNAALILAAMFLSFGLLLSYSRALTDPLSRLAVAAEAMGRGQFRTSIPHLTGQDEIGTLARSFAQMQDGVRDSFENLQTRVEVERKLYEERMQVLELNHRLKDAELLALQTQINPHFLFNTLSAGIALAGAEDAGRTSAFLENLSGFIRYTLTPTSRFVALSDEVECLDRYIWLLKLRFRDRFSFLVEVDETIRQVEVPAMILQPLVENSVGHGLSDYESGGVVIVRGYWESDHAVLSVWDNGVGMPSADVDAVVAEALGSDPSAAGGIGLRNVIRRIHLSTNGAGRVEVSNRKAIGLEVRILLPAERGSEP